MYIFKKDLFIFKMLQNNNNKDLLCNKFYFFVNIYNNFVRFELVFIEVEIEVQRSQVIVQLFSYQAIE